MYVFPKTMLGKAAFWIGVSSFALIFLQYWASMLFGMSFLFSGFLALACVIAAGIMSIIAFARYDDRAYLLFLPMSMGAFGLVLVVGELLFPH